MRVKISTNIYGTPTKLHLEAKIVYGDEEQYEHKVFHREFSLDDGGTVYFSPEMFTSFIRDNKLN